MSRGGTMLQKEAKVLFPALEAVGFGCYEVAIRISHQGCLDVWVITGLAQQTEDTDRVVVISRGL